ncbi:MAG: prenyltransferase [Pseudomonadota bacterium]
MNLLNRARPWIQAARPVAHPMIFIPLVMGQAFAVHALGQFSILMFFYALLFGVLYQIYLLYTNDHADESVDRKNTQYWLSGGSRVLPEGKLQSHHLLQGARWALVALTVLTGYLTLVADRPWICVGTLAAVVLCWAYNREPLQWSYRGHGEVLQGLGCGVVLPLIGFYLQQGSLQKFPLPALPPLFLLFLAGNLITALPDYRSDKAGGKRTFPVRHGELMARKTAVLLLALAYAMVPFVIPASSWTAIAIVLIPAVTILGGLVGSGLLQKADVTDFPACKAFVTWVSASQAWLLCSWIAVLLIGAPR